MGKMCDTALSVGDMAVSLKGHDKGRLYIVVTEVSNDFVLVADGNYRPTANPKLKRRKHLCFVKNTDAELSDAAIVRQIKSEEQNAKRR